MSTEYNFQVSEIVKFYENKTIFLTGGTGFIGKLILEKILRSCENVKKIVLLVRSKKGKKIEERLEELFDGPHMENMKKLRPNYREKIEMIDGDLRLPNCGMSNESIKILKNEVDIIIHCAATVRFDQSIRLATYINVRATKDLIEIAKSMQKLEVFLHVSTAYSFSPRFLIDEKFYTSPIKAEKLMNLVESLNDEMLMKITPTLIGEWPNTYSFTKAVTEGLLAEQGHNLPLVVARPSIVIGAAEEPLPGWIDNIYGPTSIVIACGLGVLRVVKADVSKNVDFIPVDRVVNTILVAIYDKGMKRKFSNYGNNHGSLNIEQDVSIYNICSSPLSPLTLTGFAECVLRIGKSKYETVHALWYPQMMTVKSDVVFEILFFLFNVLPAFIVDAILFCIGKKPIARGILGKLKSVVKALDFFAMREWQFKIDNTMNLWKKMSSNDKKLFKFSMENFDWEEYFSDYIRGARIYVVKDPIETIPEGLKKLRRLRVIHYTFCTFLLTIMSYILYCLVKSFY